FASFFTLTLQAGRSSSSSITTEAANKHRELAVFGSLAIGMLRSSTSDVSLLSPGVHIDEGESRSFAGFRRLDGDNVLVVFRARFQFHDVAGIVAVTFELFGIFRCLSVRVCVNIAAGL